jgi:hypothetical protein
LAEDVAGDDVGWCGGEVFDALLDAFAVFAE